MPLPVRKHKSWRKGGAAQLVASAMAMGLYGLSASAGTLEDVRSSGVLQCGVDDGVVGFSARQKDGRWVGISADFCRGLAVAVIGDVAKVNFNLLASDERVEALQSGEIDVLVSSLPISADVESRDGLLFTEPLDFQLEVNGAGAFAPAVRQGDDQWFLTVRWVRHLLLKKESTPCESFDRFSALEKGWACSVLRDTGTYADMIQRNFDAAVANDKNKLLGQGGWLFAPTP
jgi:hypothetical protein